MNNKEESNELNPPVTEMSPMKEEEREIARNVSAIVTKEERISRILSSSRHNPQDHPSRHNINDPRRTHSPKTILSEGLGQRPKDFGMKSIILNKLNSRSSASIDGYMQLVKRLKTAQDYLAQCRRTRESCQQSLTQLLAKLVKSIQENSPNQKIMLQLYDDAKQRLNKEDQVMEKSQREVHQILRQLQRLRQEGK